jgi:uncharacterized membrane protein
MSIDQTPMGGNFDMGRVVKETFGAVQKHIVVFLVGAVVLTGIPQIVALSGMSGGDPAQMFTSPLYLIGLLLTIIGGYMFQGYVVHTVVQGHKGVETTIPQAFVAALGKAFPLFLLAILLSLGVGLGAVFLLVPGIILGVMWSVSVPVMVVEGGGPINALGRSRALTKGSRWPIFGLVIVAVLISYALGLAVYGFNFAAMATAATAPALPQMIATIIVGGLSAIIYGCGAAAIYSELRMIKEGVSNDQLASVFE